MASAPRRNRTQAAAPTARHRRLAPLCLLLAAALVARPAAAHVSRLDRLTPLPPPAPPGAVRPGSPPPAAPPLAAIPLDDVHGQYNLVGANRVAEANGGCAQRITLGAAPAAQQQQQAAAPAPGATLVYGKTSRVVPHEAIEVDGVKCAPGGFVEFADVDTLLQQYGIGGNDASNDAIAVAVARDSKPRVCGKHNFSGAFQMIDNVPAYTPTLESMGAAPAKGGFASFQKGYIHFPVVRAGPPSPNDPLVSQPGYCWYQNSRKSKSGGSSEKSSSSCFPADATVHLENGSTVAMRDLAVGDRVLVAHGLYSEVFMFTHRPNPKQGASTVASPAIDSPSWNNFVTLTTASGHSLALTSGHVLPLANGRVVPADRVAIGDHLIIVDSSDAQQGVRTSPVLSIGFTRRPGGLYNPQTLHGDIVVDGVVATTYTTAVAASFAHVLLAPFRLVFRWTGMSTNAFDAGFGVFPEVLLPTLRAAFAATEEALEVCN